MPPGRFILVGGGCRSGKSSFALARARILGTRRLFIATAQAGDDEMRARIASHRRTRGDDFETVEEPLALPEAVRAGSGREVILIDCLTLWLANLLIDREDPAFVLERVDDLIAAVTERSGTTLVVTNEVGMGIVPETPLGRTFRDLAGTAHQRLSRRADEVYFAVLGTMLRLKPSVAFAGEGEHSP